MGASEVNAQEPPAPTIIATERAALDDALTLSSSAASLRFSPVCLNSQDSRFFSALSFSFLVALTKVTAKEGSVFVLKKNVEI